MSERSRRFRRFRRRTADDFNNRPAIIRRDGNNLSRDGDNLASNSLVDDRLTDLTLRDESSFNQQRNPRRKSIKRDREDDISTGNKRRSVGCADGSIQSTTVIERNTLINSPLIEEDILKPLKQQGPVQNRTKVKARRRSIAVIKEFEGETPTKTFNGLKDLLTLTPETDEESTKSKDSKKETNINSKPIDQSEWMTVKDIFSAMKKEAYEKWVPCPIYSAEKPDKIQERHRMILIEWLIEVATEERYRRTTFHLCLSILDRFLHFSTSAQKNLQTVGTAALLLAAKLEEVVPPDIYKLVDFGDGAVDIQNLIKIEAAICHILKWKINSVTPLQFLLLYLQSPTVISTKPSMPNFNSILLFYSSTVLDITRLDSHSYIYPFHIISAAIIIRLLDYIELSEQIQSNMKLLDAPFSISSSTKIKSFIHSHVQQSEISNWKVSTKSFSLSYVNPIIILLMADVISKIEDESFLGVPQSRASHGCPFENSRLQSNLMGEQGTVSMVQRANTLRNQMASSSKDKLLDLVNQFNTPADFVMDENLCGPNQKPISQSASGPAAHSGSSGHNQFGTHLEPISPP